MASECFDRVVFMGDLNYRVAEEYGAVCEAIARNDMACLLGLDQLQQVMLKHSAAPQVFSSRRAAGDIEKQCLH